ncbi:MAG: hypothetical protein AB2552_00535 [Candidatus Thiodiazotropha endolucinida]
MANGMVKFSVKLALLSESDGGRRTPIENGFRTDLLFRDGEYRMSVFEFNQNLLFPEQSIEAICTVLLHSEAEVDHCLALKKTIIADGSNVIGNVEILDVLGREDVIWQ